MSLMDFIVPFLEAQRWISLQYHHHKLEIQGPIGKGRIEMILEGFRCWKRREETGAAWSGTYILKFPPTKNLRPIFAEGPRDAGREGLLDSKDLMKDEST